MGAPAPTARREARHDRAAARAGPAGARGGGCRAQAPSRGREGCEGASEGRPQGAEAGQAGPRAAPRRAARCRRARASPCRSKANRTGGTVCAGFSPSARARPTRRRPRAGDLGGGRRPGCDQCLRGCSAAVRVAEHAADARRRPNAGSVRDGARRGAEGGRSRDDGEARRRRAPQRGGRARRSGSGSPLIRAASARAAQSFRVSAADRAA